jgi:xanthine/uracil permease
VFSTLKDVQVSNWFPVLAGLATMTPMSTFAQNNGVIALTRCANRKAGYFCCAFLITMGVFSKFAAALVAIPSSVLGGMTTFLFASVAVSGMAIIARNPMTRRNRFILTASLAVGYGATLVPTWFTYVFTYAGSNRSLKGFYDAIVLILETGFAVTALLAVILNLSIPEDPVEDAKPTEGRASPAESETEQKLEEKSPSKVQDIEAA